MGLDSRPKLDPKKITLNPNYLYLEKVEISFLVNFKWMVNWVRALFMVTFTTSRIISWETASKFAAVNPNLVRARLNYLYLWHNWWSQLYRIIQQPLFCWWPVLSWQSQLQFLEHNRLPSNRCAYTSTLKWRQTAKDQYRNQRRMESCRHLARRQSLRWLRVQAAAEYVL